MAGHRSLAAISTLFLATCLWVTTAFAQSSPSAPPGTEVRVTLLHGARFTGTLISLTPTEVVVRQKPSAHDTRHLLADVRLIETIHHNTRNLAIAGAAVGLVVALSSDLCGTGRPYASSTAGEPDCITPKPLIITGGLSALGALIGDAVDRKRRRVLFSAPARKPLLHVEAAVGRRHAGLTASIRW